MKRGKTTPIPVPTSAERLRSNLLADEDEALSE
jgi:hypothetical protein